MKNGSLTFVIGPPGSGKSSYVAEHKAPNDAVLDFDALAYALGSPSPDHHVVPHPRHIRSLAHSVWLPLSKRMQKLAGRGFGCWVIHADPPTPVLASYYRTGSVVELGPRKAKPDGC